MIAVDLWAPQPPRDEEGAETYEGWEADKSLANFKGILSRFGWDKRVKVLQMRTVEEAELVEDKSLDFVFIDADHSYSGCLADIKAWTPKVRPGGMVSGHDYEWPTVMRAVSDTGGADVVASDNVWIRYV